MDQQQQSLQQQGQHLVVKGCKGDHGEFGAFGAVTLRRPAHMVFGFLTAPEKQPLWNAGVRQASVVRTEGCTKHVHQVGGVHMSGQQH